MKTKLAALILAATFGLAASSFADEPHTQTMKIKPRRLIGAKGGAITVRINCAGEFPMIFKADEVELFSDRKPGGMLLAE